MEYFDCGKKVAVALKIIHHPQGCRNIFEASRLENEDWTAPEQIQLQ